MSRTRQGAWWGTYAVLDRGAGVTMIDEQGISVVELPTSDYEIHRKAFAKLVGKEIHQIADDPDELYEYLVSSTMGVFIVPEPDPFENMMEEL